MTRGYIEFATPELFPQRAPDPWDGNRPATVVGDGFTQAQAYASVAFNTAQAYISNLTDIAAAAADLPTITAELDSVATAITSFATPTLPERPVGLDLSIPDAPIVPAIGAIDQLVVGDVPVFDAVAPDVNTGIDAPDPLSLVIPGAPTLRDPVLPEAPTFDALAAVDTLNLPSAPEFTAQRPETDLSIAAPTAFDGSLPTPPVVSDPSFPEAPGVPDVASIEGISVGDAPVYTGTAPILNLDRVAPDPVEFVLPNPPAVGDAVWFDAPASPVIGNIEAVNVGDAPEFSAQAPITNFDLAKPEPLTLTFPSAPAVADAVIGDAPALPVVSDVTPLSVGDAPAFTAAPPDLNFDIARPDSFTPTLPEAPVISTINVPDAPADPTLDAVDPLDIGAAPEFTATTPVLNLDVAPPSALSATVPVAPVLDDVVIPDSPELLFPDAPTLREIEIPPVPELTLPTFDATIGDVPSVPDVSFSWGETPYASELLDQLRTHLQTWVGGASTGLEAVVEEAIWNRMRDREQRSAAQTSEDVMRQFAVRGFNRPPGAVAVALQKAMQVLNDNTVSASREIAIQQSQLEQQNRQFAFSTALNVESMLVNYTSQIASRALDAAKFAASIGIEVFRAEVTRYQADIAAFQARAEVFKALIQAELARLDIFRVQIEAQKLIGEVNQQEVAIYTARLGGVQALIELFRSRIQAAQATADVQRTKIQAYATEVNAYGEQVRAKASEYDAYATQIRAEVSKAETFKVEADAFQSRVAGFTAILNARTAEKNSEVEVKQRIPLELFKARTEGFRNIIAGLQTATETDRTRVQSYSAQVSAQGELTRARALDVDVFRASIDAERNKAETYRLQAEAYGRQVDAYRAITEALARQKDVEIKVGVETPIEINKQAIAIYEAGLRGVQIEATKDDARVRAYAAEIEALNTLVRARATDVDVYRASIDAEKAKADTYKIEVDAYSGRVNAFKALTDAVIAAKNIEVKLEAELPIEVAKANIAAFDASLRGATNRIEVDRTRVQAYSAEVAAIGELTKAKGVEVEVYKASLDGEKIKADAYKTDVEAFSARVNAYKAIVESAVEAKKMEIRVGAELPIEISKARIAVYDAAMRASQTLAEIQRTQVQAYSAQVDAYGKTIQAKGLENDIYKTRVDAERTKADVYRVDVEAYRAHVEAFDALIRGLVAGKNSEIKVTQEVPLERLKAEIDLFRAAQSGVETTVRADAIVVDRYRAELDGISKQIDAHRNAVDTYKATLDGERVKTDVYRTQAEAFNAVVNAYRAQVDALVKTSDQQIKIAAELPIELYRAQAQGYDSVVRGEAARLNAVAGAYETDGRVFESLVRGESARINAEADVYRADTDRVTKFADTRLEAGKANLQRAIAQINVLVESIKAGGDMAARLASAALSMVNLSGGMSASESYNTSASTNDSRSNSRSLTDNYSEIHSFQGE